MIDSHCHLYFDSIINDFDNVINRAKENGVSSILSINTLPDDFDLHYNLIKKYKSIFLSFGIHPNNINENNILTPKELISFSLNERVVGIGETGLDFFKSNNNIKYQIKSFENHIECSDQTGLPLIIHQRNSEDKIIDILSYYQKTKPLKVVFHCFTGTKKLKDFCLDNGYYISLSGIITFKNAQNLRDIIIDFPIEHTLIETDSPFLSPEPYRGKPNEPSYVLFIAQYLSKLYNISFEDFVQIIDNNFYKLFSKAIKYNQISI